MQNNNAIITQPDDYLIDATKKSYTIIDNWIFQRTDLSINEKMVYIVLKKHAWDKAKCFPSQKLIAEEASISITTVKENIKSLIQKELLLTISNQKHGKSNLYFLCDPSTNIEEIKQLLSRWYPYNFTTTNNLNSCDATSKTNNTSKTQQCASICFNCKKEIKEIYLINSNDLEIEVSTTVIQN